MEGSERSALIKYFKDLNFDIIRLKKNDKRPADTWKESKEYGLDALQRWSGNFGVALGDRSHGVVVVDLDQPELYQYFKDLDTLTIKTPNKGYHIYLKSAKPQRKIPNFLFKPIDLQGNGSYVVIPPSEINGRAYEIIKDLPIMEVTNVEKFVSDQLQEVTFTKTVDCREMVSEVYDGALHDHGHYLTCSCPFHPDDTPSMAIYEDGIKCFGCGWYGDAQSFLQKYKGMDYADVLDYLDIHGIEVAISDELKLQTKRQQEIMRLTSMIKSKYPMVTDVVTGRPYLYYKKMNVWKDIKEEAFFFRQLIAEETDFIPLDEDMNIIYQYVLNPKREDSDWIGFKNLTVNAETGEMRSPSEEIFTTTWLNYNYNPKAKGEWLEQLLKEILCDEKDGEAKLTFFYEMVGYLFTGHNNYNKMFFLTGTGANGKSTLMDIIRRIFEGYTTAVQLQDLSKNFGLQPLLGKKINIVYDLSAKALTDLGTIKAITGEDGVNIDRKYEKSVYTKLGTKILATGNILPKVDEETYAFFRRVVHLQLRNTFTNPDTTISHKIANDIEGMEWLIYKSIQAYQNVKRDGWSINEDMATVQNSYIKLSDPLGWVCENVFDLGEDDDYLTREQAHELMVEKMREEEMAVPRKKALYYDAIREHGGVDDRKTVGESQRRIFRNIRPRFAPKEMLGLDGFE